MTWKKRIISIVLCLCALLCAASVRAEAADHTNHLVCGGTTCTHAGDKHTSSQTWTAWNGGDITYDTNGIAYIYLSDDVTLQINNDFGKPKFLDVGSGKTLYLCLNGHSLTNRGSHTISVDGTLVLCDCKGSGKISHTTEEGGGFSGSDGIYVGSGAAFTMYGGTISSNNEGVQVFKGTFTMYGGKISNNDGRGVLVSGGTFTMYGGEISHNTHTTSSPEGGGGVWVKNYKSSKGKIPGNFAMYGGTICNNEIQSSTFGGGGVGMDSDGSFYMENGTITGNKCNNSGGGLDIRCKTITIKGNSTISNNTCDGDGGGIFAISSGESSITNCTISGNNATGTNSKGGGLAFQNSTFTLKECAITDNKATGKGGGIFVLDNTANLTLSGGLNFSGNQDNCPADKSGNLTTGTANDVFLHTGAYLRLASDFSKTSTAPIVVTTYFTPSDNSYQKIAVDNRTTPDPTDFKYGNDDTAICTYTVTEGENKTVELRACKHSGAWKPNTDDASSGHWRKCTNCDTTETASHSGGEASCTKKAVCQVCNQPYGGLAAHVYDTTKWVKIDNDHHGHKCNNCNAIDTTSKASHDWNSGTVTTPATCTTPGERTYTCTACSVTKIETIDASGHDFSVRQYGENEHWMKCSRCDATDKKEAHSGGEATCTQKAVCEKCGQKYGDLKAHDFANGPYRYDGEQHWHKCANCTATTEPVAHTDFTAWKSDRSGHWHECSTCGYKTAVNAHTPDRDKATETTPQLCTECGYVIAPATHPEHTWVFVAETPATCNAAGEREHYKCTCGRTSFKNGDTYAINEDASVLTIEKNSANHTGAPDSKWHSDSANHWQEYTCCHARANEAAHSGGAATCTAQAVCEVCGKAYGPLAAHAWQPATCTAPKTCTACHVTEGAALGHDWGAWKVTTPATKDAPGVETRTCAHNSAHTETRSIPKLSTAVYTVSEDTKIAQIEAKVDGLDKILESDENKALVNDGKSVGVSLTVKNTASSGVSEKIKEKLAGSNLVGLRLELTVEKTVTANGVVEPKQTIHDAGVLLNTTITLPAELQGKSGYVVYRLHDGNVHVLTETANENGEFISVSADKTQITICARLYSEYVIAYQTGGSSGGGYHPVNPTPVKATSANTGDAGVLLYGVTAALSLTGTAWLGAKSRKH